ncbi:hypothetical protein D3C72_1982550 [compost metagenome]
MISSETAYPNKASPMGAKMDNLFFEISLLSGVTIWKLLGSPKGICTVTIELNRTTSIGMFSLLIMVADLSSSVNFSIEAL